MTEGSGLARGALLGERYVVLEELGAGAMGSVHLAHQVWLDRMVAVKVLRTDGPVTARARRRLHREARAVARISHPNVVQVHDYGETVDARPFLVMERVAGPTAHDWFAEGPPLEAVLDAADAALAGLAAAHAAGVLHRDLKPANMLVRDADPKQLVLVDFGIAAVLRTPGGGNDDSLADTLGQEGVSRLTRPGTVMGTPLYMSPEQALGEEAGPPSDVYAMGVILYEWLHGRPPFRGAVREVMHAHVYRTLPHEEPRHALPPGLRDLLHRALAKEPERRFADAAAMRRALARVRRFRTTPGEPAPAPPPRRAPAPPTVPVASGNVEAAAAVPAELPFAGRDAQHRRLLSLLRAEGRGRVVVLRGAAGMGKTRMAREAAGFLARAGLARVGVGVAREDAAPLAEVATALAELDGAARDVTGGDEGSRAPGDLGDALERRCRATAARAPVLLQLDDLERAGEATFAFLERLAGAQLLDPFPLSVVATLDAGASSEAVRAGVTRLSRHAGETVEILDLGRLSDAAVEALLQAALPLSEEAARRLAAPCGGSPLLASHVLRHAVREGALRPGPGGWELPDDALADLGPSASVEELLRFRLRGLTSGPSGPSTASVLEAAAVLGDRFDVERLEDVLGAGGVGLGDAELDDILDELLEEGALAEVPGDGDRLRWDSGLLRALVLADMQGSRRRRRLSSAAAEALTRVPGTARAVVELFRVAGDAQAAAPFAVRAGEAAVEAAEWSDAVRLLTFAVGERSLDPELRVRALLALAEADNALGRRESAEARFEEALGVAGTPLDRARARFGGGRSRFNRGDAAGAIGSLRAALEALEGREGRPESRLRNRVARTLGAAVRAAGAAGEEGEAWPPGPTDGPRERLEYHKTVGYLALLRGRHEAAVAALQQALGEARGAGVEADEPRILCDLGAALRRAGRPGDAERALREGLDSARRVRTRPLEAKLLNELGELAREAGDADSARRHYDGAVAIWDARGDHHAFLGRLNLALTDVQGGRAEQALAALRDLAEAGAPDRWTVPFCLTRALAAAAARRHDLADADLHGALAELGEGPPPPEVAAMLERLATVWEAAGEEARAAGARRAAGGGRARG